jgi:hypothetical protein
MANDTGEAGAWYSILGAALKIPGARVNRKDFLSEEFKKYCDAAVLNKVLSERTVAAGVNITLMDRVAKDVINLHSGIATSISFATGIPGGLTMLATVPADIAQYYYHVIVVAQKLAYIYGFSDLEMEDDDFKALLTVLVGVMASVEEADKTLAQLYSSQIEKNVSETNDLVEADKTLAQLSSTQVKNDATKLALVKSLNKIVLRIAVALSYHLTGRTVFKSIWKAIPIIGGVVSGGITLFTFMPMSNTLKDIMHKNAETAKNEAANSSGTPKSLEVAT